MNEIETSAAIAGEESPTIGLARTRIRVETRHLAYLDGLAARVRILNNGHLSRAKILAVLVRVLLSARLDSESVRSESVLLDLLQERSADPPVAGGMSRNSTLPDPGNNSTEAVTLRISLDQLVQLDFLLADFRRKTGVFVGRSGAIRALINWLAGINVRLQEIRTDGDLERRLTRLVCRSCENGAGAAGPSAAAGKICHTGTAS